MSALTLPAIPHGRKTSKKEGGEKSEVTMDLEAIRARRARLEAMTQAKRFPASHMRPPAAPSSASKIRRKQSSTLPRDHGQQRPPTRGVKLQPLSHVSPDQNALDKHMAEDPLLRKTSTAGSAGRGGRGKEGDSGAGGSAPTSAAAVDTAPTSTSPAKPSSASVKTSELPPVEKPNGDNKPADGGDKDNDSDSDKRKTENGNDRTEEKNTSNPSDEVQEEPRENWREKPEFQTALRQLKSLREDEQLAGASAARQQLSVTMQPPIQEYIDERAVPLLISLLDKHHNPSLQFQALWALTNIASGTSHQTFAVIDAGGIPPIQRLLSSTSPEIAEQAVWAMGNIAGDGPDTRNIVVSSGSIPLLFRLVPKLTSVGACRNMAWTFSNLLRHKPYTLGDEEWGMCYQALKHYLLADDHEAKLDAAWGIAFASDGDNNAIDRVIDLQVLPQVSDMLYSENKQHVKVALRIVGNIVSGDDEQTDAVVRAGIVPRLVTLLSRTDIVSRPILKEAAWALSNVMAGNSQQIQAAIDANALPHLVMLLSTESIPLEVTKEVAWCLSNCTSEGTSRQIDELVSVGALKPMVAFLNKDGLQGLNIVGVLLEACSNILKKTTKLEQVKGGDLDMDEMTQMLARYEEFSEAKALKQVIKDLQLDSDSKEEDKNEEKGKGDGDTKEEDNKKDDKSEGDSEKKEGEDKKDEKGDGDDNDTGEKAENSKDERDNDADKKEEKENGDKKNTE